MTTDNYLETILDITVCDWARCTSHSCGAMHCALCLWHQFNTSAVDFSDALIGSVAQQFGCARAVTFDKNAAKLATRGPAGVF